MSELIPAGVSEDVLEIVRRVRSGETTFGKIARERGMYRMQLYRLMLGELGEAYHELVTDLLVTRVAEADEDLDSAADKVEVAKRKAQASFARMDLERRRPALYGPKQEVKHSGGAPTLNIVLLDRPSDGGRVVEGTPVPATPGPAGGAG